MRTKLSQKAHDAIKLSGRQDYKKRANSMELIDERGFALILYWNQIEAALKVIRYNYAIKDGWPDKLNFLGTTWKPLQDMKKGNIHNYDLVLGKSSNSLWVTRNRIAHEGLNVSVDSYIKYVEAASWVISELMQIVPNAERLRDKKRRSDAQLTRNKN